MRQTASHPQPEPQRLHLVFGGELTSLDGHEFRNLSNLDIVGVFPDYDAAFSAWKGAAQRTVDNAMIRYVIVHLHKLLEPASDAAHATAHAHDGSKEAAAKP